MGLRLRHPGEERNLCSLTRILKHSRQKLQPTIASCINCSVTVVAAGICHMVVDLIEMQCQNFGQTLLLPPFKGVAGDETNMVRGWDMQEGAVPFTRPSPTQVQLGRCGRWECEVHKLTISGCVADKLTCNLTSETT